MAAGKAVITIETEATAEWPAIDPQTWRPRGLAVNDAPIAVTVDPRDEEHSLMLAIRRLRRTPRCGSSLDARPRLVGGACDAGASRVGVDADSAGSGDAVASAAP